jgi:hypothetical protein
LFDHADKPKNYKDGRKTAAKLSGTGNERGFDPTGTGNGRARDFVALLPITERVLGAEHAETLTTRANLAYWTERTRKR